MVELIRITPDKKRTEALLAMAEKHLERIQALSINESKEFSFLNLLDYYDAMKNLLIALLLVKGFKAQGEGFHAELISFAGQNYSQLTGFELNLMNKLRQYRNRVSYEGFNISEDYLERNEEAISRLIEKLISILEKELK